MPRDLLLYHRAVDISAFIRDVSFCGRWQLIQRPTNSPSTANKRLWMFSLNMASTSCRFPQNSGTMVKEMSKKLLRIRGRSCTWCHMPLILGLSRQKQLGLMSWRPARSTKWVLGQPWMLERETLVRPPTEAAGLI